MQCFRFNEIKNFDRMTAIVSTPQGCMFNNVKWLKCKHIWPVSLWHCDGLWWHRSGSNFFKVMACCLTAPRHYLNQCWRIINQFVITSISSIFGQSLTIPSWSNVTTCKPSCLKFKKKYVSPRKINEKYGVKNHDLLFMRLIKYSPPVFCDINDVTGINDIVKRCSVIITTITSSFMDVCINKPPLSNDAL